MRNAEDSGATVQPETVSAQGAGVNGYYPAFP